MEDYIGNPLRVGDKVVYVATGKYGFMEKTTVVGFTEKKVRLESKRTVSPDHLIIYSPAPVMTLEDIL